MCKFSKQQVSSSIQNMQYHMIQKPTKIKVIEGQYKDFVGDIWDYSGDRYQAVTAGGHYFTIEHKNTEVIETRPRRISNEAYFQHSTKLLQQIFFDNGR